MEKILYNEFTPKLRQEETNMLSNMLSNSNYTTEILDLQGAIVKNVETASNKLTVHVEMPVTEHICPACSCKTSRIHDYRVRHIKDVSVAGLSLTLAYRRRRYRCTSCGKCFPEKTPSLPDVGK